MASLEQPAPTPAAAPKETIVHRKAKTSRAERQSRAMSLAKALRLTFAKRADAKFDMSLGVISVRRETRTRETLAETLEQNGLRMVFDGPSRTRAGIILDPDFSAALVQQQTMGKVLPDGGQSTRALTATDAAICAPFLEDVLAHAARLPEDREDRQLLSGLQFGVWVEDARLLGMALEAQDYEIVQVDVDIEAGVRQGNVTFYLPRVSAVTEDAMDAATEHLSDALDDMLDTPMSETVMNLEADLRVCLAKVQMSLRDLGELRSQSVIELGHVRFDQVSVQSVTGETVAKGLLGQLDGQRAVKLSRPRNDPLPAFSPLNSSEGLAEEDVGAVPFDTGLLDGETAELPILPDLEPLNEFPDLSAEAEEDVSELSLPELDDFEPLPDLPELDP